jgi:hypothetical protein
MLGCCAGRRLLRPGTGAPRRCDQDAPLQSGKRYKLGLAARGRGIGARGGHMQTATSQSSRHYNLLRMR